jgi:hypothetical protein
VSTAEGEVAVSLFPARSVVLYALLFLAGIGLVKLGLAGEVRKFRRHQEAVRAWDANWGQRGNGGW